MKNIDINSFSGRYEVRRLKAQDAGAVLELMEENPQYYEYCGKTYSIEEIRRDMELLPPGKKPEEKYYLGFFEHGLLVAVMDFIDGYPDEETAYIGFFMLTRCYQGKKIATAMVERICLYCQELGYKRVMLGYEKNNPQSSGFWKSNYFVPLREVEQEGSIIVVAGRSLEKAPEPDFADYLLAQSKAHPSFGPRDALKMCYQAAFGSEHGTADPVRAGKYLRDELKSLEGGPSRSLYEPISPSLCRVDLRAWKARGLGWRWLYNIFAAAEGDGDMDVKLSAVAALARDGKLPFGIEAWEKELALWQGGPVSHSEAYREKEEPAYRIAPMRYMAAMPVLEEMAKRPEGCIVVIDGNSNAGKSSMAESLCRITGAGAVHTDDFLQPAGRMTVVRKGMPGGNIAYDMIKEQVLPYLRSGKGFYHKFFENHLVSKKRRYVRSSPYRIVEGSFSQHPYFGDYGDIKVFMSVDKATQRRRVLLRDGDRLAPSYFGIWIPMEDQYCHYFKLKEKAHIVIET